MASMSILVVDDDPNIRDLVRLYLEKEDYRVLQAGDGQEALDLFRDERPQLVVLDLMLPRLDGWEVLKRLRGFGEVPILMLTAKGERADKLEGFRLGADDYLVKPFDPVELVARVQAILRRAGKGAQAPASTDRLQLGDLLIDRSEFRVSRSGCEVELTPKEFELLYYLAVNRNRVLSRDQVLDAVWGFDYVGDPRTVDVHVKRLRDKLAPNPTITAGPDGESERSTTPGTGRGSSWRIRTIWGVGYKFEVSD